MRSLDAFSKRGILLMVAGGGLIVLASYVIAVPVVLIHALAHPREFKHVLASDFRRLNQYWSDFLIYDE